MTLIIGLEYAAREIHETAVAKGFWDRGVTMDVVAGKIALIHSEVTELLEALRKNKGDVAVLDEMADIVIRTLDLYAALADHESGYVRGILANALDKKMRENKERTAKHGWSWG